MYVDLHQVPEALPHPQRLIRAIQMLDASSRGRHGIRLMRTVLAPALLLALLEFLVQALEQGLEPPGAQDGDAEHGRDDAVALPVPVVLEAPDVAAGHVAQLRERVDQRDGHGPLRRGARERRADPRVEHDEPRVRARLQEQRHVARRYVERRHADDEPDESADYRARYVPELDGGAGVSGQGLRFLSLFFFLAI